MKLLDIIKLGEAKGIKEIELYSNNTKSLELQFKSDNPTVEINDFLNISLRGLVDGKMGNVSLESIEEDKVNAALDQLIDNAHNISSSEQAIIFDGKAEYEKVVNKKSDLSQHSIKEKLELATKAYNYSLSRINEEMKNNPGLFLKVATLAYAEQGEKVNLINNKGVDLNNEFYCGQFVCYLIGATQSGSVVEYKYDFFYNIDEFKYEEVVNKTINAIIKKLNPGSVVTKRYPVVLDKDVISSLLGAYSMVLSGESAMNKTTPLLDKVDKKIFGDNINIVEDPFNDRLLAKEPFDDEGYPKKRYHLVKNGVFKGFAHSLKTAKYFNTTPTGNGNRIGGVRFTNLSIEPDNNSFDKLLEGIDEGVYINDINGIHAGVNPVAGTFNLQSSGFMIRNGKLAEPVTLFVMSGTFEELFNSVEMISNDVEKIFARNFNCPSLRIKSLAISGK